MDFNHLVEQSQKFSRIVYMKCKPENQSSEDIACYAIQHLFQLSERSETFREKANDLNFLESALYNSCRRAVDKSRVYSSVDAMEHRSRELAHGRDTYKNIDLDEDFIEEPDSAEFDIEVSDSEEDSTSTFLSLIDERLPEILEVVTSNVAMVILSETIRPSQEMTDWLDAERHRVSDSQIYAKMNYRAFEAIYGITQAEYHSAIRHIRQKTAKMGVLNLIENHN